MHTATATAKCGAHASQVSRDCCGYCWSSIQPFKPFAYPFVRFDGEKKLHRLAVEVENISKGFDRQLFKNFSIMVEAGERIAIIGANGAGKTTMLRCIAGDLAGLQPDQGRVKWAENANVGYMPQDPTEDFAKDTNLTDWIGQWTKEIGRAHV